MKTKIISVKPELDVFEMVQFFSDNHLRHAPVLDENQRLLGIISRRDILKALEELVSNTNEIADAGRSTKVSYWKEKYAF